VAAAHDGRREIHVTAKVGTLAGSVAVLLRPGSPARAAIRFPGDSVREGESVDALVDLRDAGGNPVSDAALELVADGARTEPPREVQAGLYAVRMHVDPLAGMRSAQLRVRCGAVDEVARIDVVRDERPDRIAAGALLGGQSNLARANAASVQAELSAHAGSPALEVVARAGLLQFATARDSVSGVSQRGELRGLSFAAGVRASVPLGRLMSIHGALLGGALRSFGAVTVESGPASGIREGTAQWGAFASALLGASIRAGRGRAVAELQLAFAPGRGDLAGNLGGVGVSLGYLFTLR